MPKSDTKSFSGLLIRGEGIATHTTGYPTLNLDRRTLRGSLPKDGLWSCYAKIQGKRHPATLIIGVPYQRTKRKNGKVEVHVLGKVKARRGERIEVEIVAWIRPLIPYTGIEALQKQIQKDLRVARRQLKL